MIRFRGPLMALCLLTGIAAQPALADPAPIQIDVATPWRHEETGVVLPARIAAFSRSAIVDLSKSQSDVAASYRDGESGTFATVYLFRAGLADVSLW